MKYSEISHFSHPHHKLRFEYTESPFKCDGCMEVGIGSSYKCGGAACDFDLHTHCAVLSTTIRHPFYTIRYCNACEKRVTGFVYHCKSCGFDLHPCCAKLPMVPDDGDIKLYLYAKVTSPCHRCGRKGRSWSYRSSCKKYNLHVACVKEMLADSWHELYEGSGGGAGLNSYTGGKKPPQLESHLETRVNHSKRKGKAQKCCEVAILGDPTTLIAGVVGSLMSR